MTRPRRNRSASGFTLIELMIAVAITAIVMMALIQVFSSQQRVFAQQTDLANTQSIARNALYLMARDIRMAGYAGGPNACDELSGETSGEFRPVFSLADGATWLSAQSNCTLCPHGAIILTGLNNGSARPASWHSDAIEVRGNFLRSSANLTATYDPAVGGGKSLTVSSSAPFEGTLLNKPGWVAIVDLNNLTAEMGRFSSASGGVITLVNVLGKVYDTSLTQRIIVAPILSRAFALNEDTGELVIGAYDPQANNVPAATVEVLADHIHDFQINYGLSQEDDANPLNIPMTYHADVNLVCDPCTLKSVRLRLWTISDVFRDPGEELIREFSTLVEVRNTGLDVRTCMLAPASACSWQY